MNQQKEIPTPQDLYRFFYIVRNRNWAALFVLTGLAALAVAYLLFGKVTITAQGNAMFLTPGSIVPFESTGNGQIKKWRKKVGDDVQKDEVLAVLEQPEIEKKLEQARQKLADAEKRTKQLHQLTDAYISLERKTIERRSTLILNRIDAIKKQLVKSKQIAQNTKKQKSDALDQKKNNLEELLTLYDRRDKDRKDIVNQLIELRRKGLATEEEIIRAREKKINQTLKLAELNLEIIQLGIDKLRAENDSIETQKQIALREEDISHLVEDLFGLVNRKGDLDRLAEETASARKLETSDLTRLINGYEKELSESRFILSPTSGRIIELTAGESKVIAKGQRLGSIDASKKSEMLGAIAYFTLSDGKKIKRGMPIRLTPATVQRERYGSVMARVRSASTYSVSQQAVTKEVGNAKVSTQLTEGGRFIQVHVELDRDKSSPTRLLWDLSSGPKKKIASGVFASATVELEERSPLALLLPMMGR